MLKKLLLSILASLVLFFNVSVPFAKAQGVWYDQSFKEWYVKVYDQDLSPASEIFGERYTAAQVQWILYSFLAFHLNFIPGGAIMTCILTGDMGDCWMR